MAIEVPEGVQGLFLVLTGEKWPTANEDALREVGNAWGTAGDRLEGELGPYLVQVVQNIKENFTGKSAIKFAEMMAPYAAEPPYYIPQASQQFQQLKKFLLDAATQVEYVKIISIEELVLLIAQIAWAIAMAFWTDGASMTWLAARMAIVRFLLRTWWGRLVLQFVLAELFGIAFQVALDVLTQAIQFAMHHRTSWDVQSTVSAVEVGAVGGALSLPFSAISHWVSHKLTGALTKLLGRDIEAATLQPVVVRAVDGAARNLGDKAPISTFTKDVAKDITDGLFKAADKPLRIRLTEIGVPALIEMTEEGLHEVVTEGVVMAANGQGFQFNPFSFTSGVASNAATKLGHGIGTTLAGPHPPAKGYTRLPDDPSDTNGTDGEHQPLLPAGSTGSGSVSETTTLVNPFSDEKSFASPPPTRNSTPTPSESTRQNGSGRADSATTTTPSSTGSGSRGTTTSPSTGSTAGGGTSSSRVSSGGLDGTTRSETPPPVPPKDGTRSTSETAPQTPSKNGEVSSPGTGRSTASTSTPPTQSRSTRESGGRSETSPSTATPGSRTPSNGEGPARTESSTSVPSPGRTNANSSEPGPTPARSGGRSTGEPTGPNAQATAGAGSTRSTSEPGSTRSTSEPGVTGTGNGTPATRSTTETPATRGTGNGTRGDSTTSGGPLRDGTRSATTTPGTTSNGTKPTEPAVTGEAAAGANQNAANPGTGATPATKPPGQNPAENGRSQDTNPFRNGTSARIRAAAAAEDSHTVLPESLTKNAATVPAANLAGLTKGSLPLAERLIVTGPAEVNQVQAAAQRLGIDVVARVDRAQLGIGRRKGSTWMTFPANGSRPRPLPPGQLTPGQLTATTDVASVLPPPVPPKHGEVTTAASKGTGEPSRVTESTSGESRGNASTVAARTPADTPTTTVGGGRLSREVTDHLVGEVNSRLREFGSRWTGGRVEADAVRQAMSELPQGGPTDPRGLATDIAHQIAFGEVPRLHGGAPTVPHQTGDGFQPFGKVRAAEIGHASTKASGGVRVTLRDAKTGEVIDLSSILRSLKFQYVGDGIHLAAVRADGAAPAAKDHAVSTSIVEQSVAAARPPRTGHRDDPATSHNSPTPATPAESSDSLSSVGRPSSTDSVKSTGIPGLTKQDHLDAQKRREAAAKDGGVPPSRPRRTGRGFNGDYVTVEDVRRAELADKAAAEDAAGTPDPSQSPGRPLGTGKGAGIPGISKSELIKANTRRVRRMRRSEAALRSSGRPLGQGRHRGRGIEGLSLQDHRAAEERRAESANADTPARPGRSEEALRSFSGSLGTGNGKGIAGLSPEDRRAAEERRAKNANTGTPARPLRTGKGSGRDPVTIEDLRADEGPTADEGSSPSAPGGLTQTKNANGTVTLLEQPKPETRPQSGTSTDVRRTDAERTETSPEEAGRGPDRAESPASLGQETASETTAPESGQIAPDRADLPQTAPAQTAPEHAAPDQTVPAQAAPEHTAPSQAATDLAAPAQSVTEQSATEADLGRTDPDRARVSLGKLSRSRYEQVAGEARAIVRGVSGHVPANDTVRAARVEEARVLVAAEIVRNGRRAGENLAEALAPDLRPATPTPRIAREAEHLRDARSTLRDIRSLDEVQHGRIRREAGEIVDDLLTANPHAAPGRGRQNEVRTLVAAEIPRAGHQAAVNLAKKLLGLPHQAGGVTPTGRVASAAAAAMTDVDRARTTLGMLTDNRFARVMKRTQQIVGDLTGHVPADRDPGGELSRVDGIGLLVAAEIARSGLPSGEMLARDLAHILRPDTTPRVTIDGNRVDVARMTLQNVRNSSPEQYAGILGEASVIVQNLTGHVPSPVAVDGHGRQLVLVWMLVGSEIAWAGYWAAENLARDILGLPRLGTRLPGRVAAFADASRTDLDRARTTLAVWSDGRAQEFMDAASEIIDALSELTWAHVADAELTRTLIAAEIARSGHQAGEELAVHLATDPPRQNHKDTPAHPGEGRAEEPGPSQTTPDSRPEQTTPDTRSDQVAPDSPSDQAGPVPLNEMLDGTRVGTVDGRTVAIWLPGAPEDGLRFDGTTVERLGDLVPPQTVFVLGAERDGKVMIGDRPVSAETLYATIAIKAPGLQPFLLIPGAAAMAEPLAQLFNGPVLAAPNGMRFEPENNRLLFAGPTPDGRPAEEAFRLYEPGDPAGLPIATSLTADLRRQHEMTDAEPAPSVIIQPPTRPPSPGASLKPPSTAMSRSGSTMSRASTRSSIRGTRGDLLFPEDEPPPEAPPPGAPVVEPHRLDEMARSVGVPRAGLPYMPQLLAGIEWALLTKGKTFSDKQKADLVQRLLSNFPYLLGGSGNDNSSGLLVPFGSVEILVTFDPKNPQRVVRNPAGSYTAPSTLTAPDGEFAAVDTINAAYGTGAHTQTQGGQAGATRGRVAVSFGIGVPGTHLNVVRVGAAISGTANQSNLSTTHIADAERGKVEDSRIAADLIAYPEVNISFKVREQEKGQPVDRWQDIEPTRVAESGDEALLLWLAKPYTEQAASRTVTATGPEVDAKLDRLPRNYYASGLTNIPRLFDEILTTLRGQGLRLESGSVTREELLQKLWNLNTHLDDAVNEQRGYEITLHNDRGQKIATVNIHSRRLYEEGAPLVGAMSDKVHLEDVRTAIDGTSGGHTLNQSSTLAFPSVEFDALPQPVEIKDLGLNASLSLSYTSSNSDSISANRVGLWVLVPRYTGRTAAYRVQFEHSATVSVLGGGRKSESRATPRVQGRALVRMPVKEAFAHGFAVDRKALKRPPIGSNTMAYAADAVKDSGRGANDPQNKPVPLHVDQGKGIGMGLVRVADETVDAIRNAIEAEVRGRGFLPGDQDDPFAGHHWYSHGNKLRSKLDNRDLLKKMVSTQGLDSHYDQIHQDGMTFTLRKRRGIAGMDLDVDSVKITIKGRKNTATPPRYRRTTNEYHTVNLAMGMDIAGQSTSHSRKLAVGFSLRGLYKYLKGAAMGLEFQKTVGAGDSVSFLNNRPELLEFPGEVDEFELTSDYEITFEYQHSGQQGKVFNGRRDPAPVVLQGHTAVAHLLPLGTHAQQGPTLQGPARKDLLDQGLVYFLDASGLREAASRVLTDLVGPARTGDQDISTFTNTIEVRAHLREILQGEYTTNRLFDTGFFRDTFGGLDISGNLRDVTFSGSTGEKFVKGDIKLLLSENRLTNTDSFGVTWDQLDAAAGGVAGHAGLTGEADINRHWQWNTSTSSGRTGGKELIQLDFNHAYAFTGEVDFTVRSRQEKQAKLLPTGSRHHEETLSPRTMMFLFSEPEALKRYAQGSVPISDEQLTDAMTRWKDGELTLSNDTVAGILTRWSNDLARRVTEPEMLDAVDDFARALAEAHRNGRSPVNDPTARAAFNEIFDVSLGEPQDPFGHVDTPEDLLDYVQGKTELPNDRLRDAMTAWKNGTLRLSGDMVAQILVRWTNRTYLPDDYRQELVDLLYELHSKGGLPILSATVRESFNAVFDPDGERPLPEPKTRLQHMEMPEYLTRDDPGGRILGHSGIQTYKHDDGRTTYDIVRAEIERVAPGMLAAGAQIWSRQGKLIGKMHGSVDALQAMLAKGRDLGLFEELLSTNGTSFYLVNPVGWLLSDVVEINLSSVLTSPPKIDEFVPNTGIEVYSHGYQGSSVAKSRNASQSLTFAKLGVGGLQTKTASGGGALKTSEGHNRGTTRAEQGVTEQTVYDWSGHYLATFNDEMTVKVRRLKMSGRPLNNLLLNLFDGLTHHGRTASTTVPGTLELQVPRAIAEAGVMRGPSQRRNFVPLPKLPGNSFIAGTLLDDSLPIAQKMLTKVFKPSLVEKAFGAKAGDPKTRSSLSLPVLMSRLHLTNHLREATGGDTYQVAKGLVMPGSADTRADIYLKGDLYDLEVIAPMKQGTGTGRYSKHQSGTTASASTDQARLETDYNVDGSGQMGHHRADQAPHSWDFGNSGSRNTSMNQNSAGTENYRREQHAKEQGPVYLVRFRFRGRLSAHKFEHGMFHKPKPKGRFRSDPITGDVYAELFQAEINELRAQLEQATAEALPHTDPWPAMDTAPAFDLAPLLADAARDRFDASRAYQSVARHIRTQVGGDRPIVITADEAALADQTYRALLPWAVQTMRADYRAAPGSQARSRLQATMLQYRRQLRQQNRPAVPYLIPPTHSAAEVNQLISDVQAMHDLRRDNPLGAPPPLPGAVSVIGQDPVYLARDVAHALDTYVRVDIRRADGTLRQSWIDPEGRVHPFDPARTREDPADGRLYVFDPTPPAPGERAFTADLAQSAGLLSQWHRTDVDAFALSDVELGRLYRTSMVRQQTFEQAVAAEIAARRARLHALDPDLSDGARQAFEAQEFWRGEVAWREAQVEAIRGEMARINRRSVRLSAQLDEVRGQPDMSLEQENLRDEVGRRRTELRRLSRQLSQARDNAAHAEEMNDATQEMLERLRTAALPGVQGPQRWPDEVVQSTVTRLGQMSSGDWLLRTSRVAHAYRAWPEDTTGALVQQLEQDLLDAGPGSVSIVVTDPESGNRFVAANQGGEIRWAEHPFGMGIERPTEPVRMSLDLAPDGRVLNPAPGLAQLNLGPATFERIRSFFSDFARRWSDPLLSDDESFGYDPHSRVVPDGPLWRRRPSLTPGDLREASRSRSRSLMSGSSRGRSPSRGGRSLTPGGSRETPRRTAQIVLPPEVPGDLSITDAYLSVDGQYEFRPYDHDAFVAGEIVRLSQYAPVFWLTHGMPDRGVTVSDIVEHDFMGAVSYLYTNEDFDFRAFRALGRLSNRVSLMLSEPLGENPSDTWILFSGADGVTGAAIALPGGRYRTYIPGQGIRSLTREELQSEIVEPSSTVVAWPDAQDSLSAFERPFGPASESPSRLASEVAPEPDETPAVPIDASQSDGTPAVLIDASRLGGTPVTVLIDTPMPDDPHLYQRGADEYRAAAPGREHHGWRHLGALSEFTPVSWLTGGGQARGVTTYDVLETDRAGAVRFFAQAGQATRRADAVSAYLSESSGRTAEVMDTLPAELEPGTWIWFTGPDRTEAAIVLPDGYRRFIPGTGTTLTSRDRGGLHVITHGARTFVVAHPASVDEARRPDTTVTADPATTSRPAPATTSRPTPAGTDRTAGVEEQPHGTGPHTSPTDTVTTVDQQAPADSHLYIDESDGSHLVAPIGTRRDGLQDLGAISTYTPLAWLLDGGQVQPLTTQDVVDRHLDHAQGFLTEATVLGEPAEAARTLLATTGRLVELTGSLPNTLPPDTLVYYIGPDGRSGAAVVLPGGQVRRTTPAGTPLTSPDLAGLRAIDDGRHTFVIARPIQTQKPQATGTRGGDVVETAARQAARFESQVFDQAALNRALQRRGLAPVEVPTDNNCFYHSLIAIAGPYLAAHVPGLHPTSQTRANVQILRNWLADRLRADLAVAAQGLPSRYAGFFHVQEGGPSVAEQQQRFVEQIATMDSWANEAGDLVAHLAAIELGLPLTLIQDRYVENMGPAGSTRINFIRTPGHFRGARTVGRQASRVPWERLSPLPPSTPEAARMWLRQQMESVRSEFTHAVAAFFDAQQGLPDDAVETAGAAYQTSADLFQQAQDGTGYQETPPHLRIQQRIDDMRRAVREITDLTQNIHNIQSSPAGPATAAPAPLRRTVSDHLVEQVNSELRDLGPGWTEGRVDRERVESALRSLGEGSPTDVKGLANDVAHQIAFGRPTRMKGGATRGAIPAALGMTADRPPVDPAVQAARSNVLGSGGQWAEAHARRLRAALNADPVSSADVSAVLESVGRDPDRVRELEDAFGSLGDQEGPTSLASAMGQAVEDGRLSAELYEDFLQLLGHVHVFQTESLAQGDATVPPTPGPAGHPDTEAQPAGEQHVQWAELYARRLRAALNADPVSSADVSAVLRLIGRDPDRVRELEDAFASLGDQEGPTSLASAMGQAVEDGRLSGELYEHILRLLGNVDVFLTKPVRDFSTAFPPAEAVTALTAPEQFPDVRAFAERVVQAINRGESDIALELVRQLERSERALWLLTGAYARLTGRHLMEDLNSAVGLTADIAPETLAPSVHPDDADRYYRRLADSTFDHYSDGRISIPSGYPEDGCIQRAHLWVLQLRQWGIDARKIFVMAAEGQSLVVNSVNAFGATADAPRPVRWDSHVAPLIRVDPGNGDPVVDMVLDPALELGAAVPVQRWLDTLGASGDFSLIDGPAHAAFMNSTVEVSSPLEILDAVYRDDEDRLRDYALEVDRRREFRDWHAALEPAQRDLFDDMYSGLQKDEVKTFHTWFRAQNANGRMNFASWFRQAKTTGSAMPPVPVPPRPDDIRPLRGAMPPAANLHLEVQFASREVKVNPDQRGALTDLARSVREEAVRRYRQGRSGLIVHIEGGGNGGFFSRGADPVGSDRAAAVSRILQPIIHQQLSREGVPTTSVAFSVRSRGDGPTESPQRPAPGPKDDQNRRVQVWVVQDDERGSTAAQDPHAGLPEILPEATVVGEPAEVAGPLLATTGRIAELTDRGPNTLPPAAEELHAFVLHEVNKWLPQLGWKHGEVGWDDVTEALRELHQDGRTPPTNPREQASWIAHHIAGKPLPAVEAGAAVTGGHTDPVTRGGIRPMEGAEPPAGKGKGKDVWHTLVRPATEGSGTHRYQVSEAGWIRLSDGQALSPDSWVRYGDDFVHVPTGMSLRGEDGRIEPIDGWETLRDLLDGDTLVAHTMWADESYVYLKPESGGPAVGLPLVVTQSGSLAQTIYDVLSGAPNVTTPAAYSTQDSFDIEYAATVDEFPVVARREGWTVWGQGAEDPDVRVFVAENQELGGLRGQFDAGPPRAGRVSDKDGVLYREGPAWNWYLPGRSAVVASSRPPSNVSPNSADDNGVPVSTPSPDPVADRPPVDPAVTAARSDVLGSGLPHAMKWRADHSDTPLYKFSQKSPEEVFRVGLRPKGDRLGHLIEHVYGNPADTGYVSTTRNIHYVRDSALNDPGTAEVLHRRYVYRYDVVLPGGIDVNATLDIASPFPDQLEVAFPGGIDVRFIRGVQPLENGSIMGEYIVNPYFAPDLGLDDDPSQEANPTPHGA